MPQANKPSTTSTLQYTRPTLPDNTGINILDVKQFYPSTSRKYIFTANYNKPTKKLKFSVIDYSTSSALGDENINPLAYNQDIASHECKTIPSGGNSPNIHVPFLHYKYLGIDYLIFITTDSGAICNNKWGKYYAYTVDPESPTITLTNKLGAYQGVGVYSDPSTLGIGLANLVKSYAKTVDIINVYYGGVSYIVSMVYYEKK